MRPVLEKSAGRQPRIYFAEATVCALLLVFTTAAPSRAAQLTEAQQRGKAIYTNGTGAEPIYAKLAGPGLRAEGAQFPCINCHGEDGSGRLEGGVRSADIRRWRLEAPADAARDFGRTRPGYIKEALVARAIRDRIDAGGNPLHPGMPAYIVGDADLADLLEYLKVLGDESQPGVSEDAVRIGMLLPQVGPLAPVGSYVARVVRAAGQDLNSLGGIFGRRLELVEIPFDPADQDSAAEVLAAVLDEDPLFCLVASFGVDAGTEAAELAASAGIPVVAPMGLAAENSFATARNTFYLYASMADQARVLVDYFATDLARPEAKIALVHTDDRLGAGAARGVLTQTSKYDMTVVATVPYPLHEFDATAVAADLAALAPDALFFFGAGADATTLIEQSGRDGWNPLIFSTAEALGAVSLTLPASVVDRVYLASAVTNPDLRSAGMREFLAMVDAHGIEGRYKAFQLAAYAGMSLVREGLRKSGRNLTRRSFMEVLSGLWQFETGVLPAITFDENRRVGLAGAHIVHADAEHKGFIASGPWREPRP